MIALGIDAATKTGWAKVERVDGREKLLDWGVLDFKKFEREPWNPPAFLDLRCRAPAGVPDVVAIELPWLGRDPHALEVLARICGRFEQVFGPRCSDVRVVRAVQWQSKMLGNTRMGRGALKRLAVAWCKSKLGAKLPQDAADAAVMAVYVMRFPA